MLEKKDVGKKGVENTNQITSRKQVEQIEKQIKKQIEKQIEKKIETQIEKQIETQIEKQQWCSHRVKNVLRYQYEFPQSDLVF